MADFEEDGERLRLSFEVPFEHAEGLKAHIGEFAAEHAFEVKFVEDLPAQLEIVDLDCGEEGTIIHPSGLFSWVEDPVTKKHVSVITSQNLEFFYYNYEGSTLRGSPVRTLMKSLAQYQQAAEGEDFMLFDEEEAVGIKMYNALDLLRRLKHEEIGIEYEDAINQVIPFVGQSSVRFFSRFCASLFPRVAIDKATQDLDIMQLDKMLARTEYRGQAWGLVGSLATGAVFRGSQLGELNNTPADKYWPHLQYLQQLGLIDRKPSTVRAGRDSRSLTYQAWPLIKMADGRWPRLNELLARHGVLSQQV